MSANVLARTVYWCQTILNLIPGMPHCITMYNDEAEVEASIGHISSRLRFWIVDFSRTNLADYVYVAF